MQSLTMEPSLTRMREGRQLKKEVINVVVKYRLDLTSLVHIAKEIGRALLHNPPSLVMMPTFLCVQLTNTTTINLSEIILPSAHIRKLTLWILCAGHQGLMNPA